MLVHIANNLTRLTKSVCSIGSHFVILIIACALCGCKGRLLESEQRTELAQREARFVGLEWSLRKAGVFKLATAVRQADSSDRIHVYIEGDGYAWATRSRLSTDPTPREA